jgi:serine protease Do
MSYRLTNLPMAALLVWGLLWTAPLTSSAQTDDTHRRTPLVRAIENCQFSVVSLRGQKRVASESHLDNGEQVRHVNGMGTGVVIDPRGYILTNFHVVEEVNQIQVTTADRQTSPARLLCRDPVTDLAIIKVDRIDGLRPIKLGTSSDLMLAETVAAVGNAYGYEHTVTTGIISHLRRTVQINENQIYENLIQTDAPINPGNSGGPLLNLDGEMIGVNVAVRVGAQGIAFAIPVDQAVEVAARMLARINDSQVDTGLQVVTRYSREVPALFISYVESGSAADAAGIKIGDQITSLDGVEINRALEWERGLLEKRGGQSIRVSVHRNSTTEVELPLLARQKLASASSSPIETLAWRTLGVKLAVASEAEVSGRHPNYQRGLKVVAVRPSSPAELERIQVGDILVAMHGFKTESLENLGYILNLPDLRQNQQFMFYVLRGREPYSGQMRLATTGTELK